MNIHFTNYSHTHTQVHISKYAAIHAWTHTYTISVRAGCKCIFRAFAWTREAESCVFCARNALRPKDVPPDRTGENASCARTTSHTATAPCPPSGKVQRLWPSDSRCIADKNKMTPEIICCSIHSYLYDLKMFKVDFKWLKMQFILNLSAYSSSHILEKSTVLQYCISRYCMF